VRRCAAPGRRGPVGGVDDVDHVLRPPSTGNRWSRRARRRERLRPRRPAHRLLGPPRITFTNPTIASAGISEAEAREQGLECRCRVLDLEHVPRAIVSRYTGGLVKLVAERDGGRLLGVQMLADRAGDAILAGVYAIEVRMTVAELADSWNPYLTIGEAIHLAAQSFTRAPRKLSCCAG
jgi:pyruvate/2-oxoglutarate dehydrogenase complex dihydrolipoamide dehydrogenase (E3) component